MDRMTAIERLNAFDKKGRYVFTTRDLAKISMKIIQRH